MTDDRYGKIHTDGSRSGGQPKQSNIFEACDVTKHTLIVDPSYTAHTFKVKSLDDSQPTQSDALRKELATRFYRKSGEFQVGLTVPEANILAAEAFAFLQEQSK